MQETIEFEKKSLHKHSDFLMNSSQSESDEGEKSSNSSDERPIKKKKINIEFSEEPFENRMNIESSDKESKQISTLNSDHNQSLPSLTISTKRSRKNKSEIRDFFEKFQNTKGDVKLRCKTCKISEFSLNSGTSTLKKHHLVCIEKMQSSEQKISKFLLPVKKDNLSATTAQDLLIRWVLSNDQPFSVVDNNKFREFFGYCCKMYTLPCRQTLKKHIEKNYNEKRNELMLTLKNYPSKLSITADVWTSPKNEPFLGVVGN
jgi:hypothetical protein